MKKGRYSMAHPHTNHLPSQGLDYRAARARYAPRVVACTRCDRLVFSPLERAELLCRTCMDACGLGMKADQAQRRIVLLLERRIAQQHILASLPAVLDDH